MRFLLYLYDTRMVRNRNHYYNLSEEIKKPRQLDLAQRGPNVCWTQLIQCKTRGIRKRQSQLEYSINVYFDYISIMLLILHSVSSDIRVNICENEVADKPLALYEQIKYSYVPQTWIGRIYATQNDNKNDNKINPKTNFKHHHTPIMETEQVISQ